MNKIARELGIKNDAGDDGDLYDTPVNLKTAVQKEKKNATFLHFLKQMEQLYDEPDSAEELNHPAA